MVKRTLILIIALALFLGTSSSFGAYEWVLLDGELKIPRHALTGEALNGYVYAIGGLVMPGSPSDAQNAVSKYDPATDNWTLVASIPTARHSLSSAVIDGWIYAVCGHVSNSRSENQRYNGTGPWETKASVYARSGPGVAAYGGELYVFGGNHYSTILSRFDIYNPTTDTWRVGGNMPSATEPWRATALGNIIYVNDGYDLKQLWAYDPAADTWDTSIPAMNVSRSGYELQAVNGRIYAIGGSNASDGYLSSVESWAPGDTSWRMEPTLNIARNQFGSAVIGNDIYVFGGNNGGDLGSTEVLTICEPPELPPEPWSFVHITDTHIGTHRENARESLLAAVWHINWKIYHGLETPNFILVTGDIADHGCNWWHDCDNPGHYDQFTSTIGLLNIPYYPIPGNHDRRLDLCLAECNNNLTCYEAKILGLLPAVNFFPQLSVENYWFGHKGYLFIGLDTGPGNGAANDYLTDDQMEDLRELGNNNKCVPKIVFMHHPAAGGGNKMIENRDDFLDWCDKNNVKVVITGHTHQNVVCDRNGVEGWPIGETAYVQTPSCGKGDVGDRGYRIFSVVEGEVSEQFVSIQDILNNRYEVEPNSPVEVHVYDSQGRHVGGDQSSVVEGEIPGSYYLPHYSVETEEGSHDYPEKIIIFDPTDDYLCEVIGTEGGTYGLDITLIRRGQENTFEATEIPTSPGARHVYAVDWVALSAGEEGVTLDVDADGDGVFERTVIADENLTSDEFALQTETAIDFDPDVLNLRSQGKFVTVYIELPEGFDVSQIDVSTLMLNMSVPALSKPVEIGDYDSDGMADLMVKFARQQVAEVLKVGEQTIYLAGRLADGTLFAGIDIIRVLASKGGEEAIDAEEAAGFTLFEASERINELDPENFNNEDSATALTNEIYFVLSIIDDELYTEALDVLENDILKRTNGCANIGEPDENDWITTYEGQGMVYPLIVEAIELLESLMQ